MSAGLEADRTDLPEDAWDGLDVDGPETVAEQRLLATFAARARVTNLGRVVRLHELMDRGDRGALDEPHRQEAENLAHQVSGSAGTFGHPAASLDAARVERFFAAARTRWHEERQLVRDTLDRLRREFGGESA